MTVRLATPTHSHFDRALKQVGNEGSQATPLHNVAKVYEGQGRHADALSVYERGQAQTFNNTGLVYAKQGRYAEALSSYERTLRLAEKLGEQPGQAFVLSNIGNLHRAQGRYADALSSYERALDIADRLGVPERETYRRLRDQMRPQSR